MSFDIRWDLLDESESRRLMALMNEGFKDMERPDFLGHLQVSAVVYIRVYGKHGSDQLSSG
jgi:hypothetical protein